jgi:uncharacterized protein YchJ
MKTLDISDYTALSNEASEKLDLLIKQKNSLQKKYGSVYEVLEPKQKLDLESRKNDEIRIFKHLHHHCYLMSLNFIRGNRVKVLSLMDFYLICCTNKNPLGIYNATRTIIELTAFLNDISSRLDSACAKPDSDWKNKGEEYFNIIVRARYGTNNSKFQDLLQNSGIPKKKIKPINIMHSISVLKESGYTDLAESYDEMCEYVHHNLSSNTTANLGSQVYDRVDVISNRFTVLPGNITTVYRYPLQEKGNKSIEETISIVEECIQLINDILQNLKVTPFAKEQIEQFTGTSHGFVHLKPPKKKPITANYKIGRNEPCPCGSGKKYKKCCF